MALNHIKKSNYDSERIVILSALGWLEVVRLICYGIIVFSDCDRQLDRYRGDVGVLVKRRSTYLAPRNVLFRNGKIRTFYCHDQTIVSRCTVAPTRFGPLSLKTKYLNRFLNLACSCQRDSHKFSVSPTALIQHYVCVNGWVRIKARVRVTYV